MYFSSLGEGDSFPMAPITADTTLICAGCRRQLSLNEKVLLLMPIFFCVDCASFPTEAIDRYALNTPALFPLRLLFKAAQLFSTQEILPVATSTEALLGMSPFADPWNV